MAYITNGHYICDNNANIECPLGVPVQTIVWRWEDSEDIMQESLCAGCAEDLQWGAENGMGDDETKVVIIWKAALSENGVLV